ncbi:MAG: TerB N-terminal domain-containing protein [Bryobacteraceae bacterium]|nr:TerB N-terminal domain-containing protein [Bryobacteraceae bacterium]
MLASLIWKLIRVLLGAPPTPRRATPLAHSPSRRELPSLPATSVAIAPPISGWVPLGESVTVRGVTIPGGMFYLSSGASDPTWIDPTLPIDGLDRERPDWIPDGYASLQPSERRAYLHWLAGGRQDPHVDPDLVMLYFWGLERRAFFDQISEPELALIVAEVQRLEAIYGNSALEGCTAELLAIHGPVLLPTKVLGPSVILLRRGLGQFVHRQDPLPADWALAWLSLEWDLLERPAVARIEREFREWFALKYQQEFGAGMRLPPNKKRLKILYEPTHPTLPATTVEWPLPDVMMLRKPIEKLTELASEVREDLDGYLRFVGRHPGEEDSPAALSLLPPPLARARGPQALTRFLDQRLASVEFAEVAYAELRAAWAQLPEAPAKREAIMVAQVFDRLGYGFEPDARFGAQSVSEEHPLIVFRQSEGPSVPSPDYASATLFAHLGAMLAHADGTVNVGEKSYLIRHATRARSLSLAESRRLEAYLRWLLRVPPAMTGVKRRLEQLPVASRAELGLFLANLASADGDVSPAEVSLIGKLYERLGIDPKRAYGDIHAAATEPVRMALSSEPAPAYRIPAAPRPGPRVDLAKVQAMQVETERVSELLRGIFVEEAVAVTPPAAGSVSGLDAAHSGLVHRLLAAAGWPRADFNALASEAGLLPDGALDTINEMALDRAGDLLLEGDDPVTLNPATREALQL